MSVMTLPAGVTVKSSSWGQQRNDLEFSSIFGSQSIEGSSPLWTTTLVIDDTEERFSGPAKSLLISLRGKTNQLALHDLGRPAPLGSMRGTMSFSGNHAQGLMFINVVAAGQAGKTLQAGDLIGFGSGLTQQVVMITNDAVANGSGVISLSIEPPLRNAFSGGAAIVWDKPTALFRRKTNASSWDYNTNVMGGLSLDLVEDVRP